MANRRDIKRRIASVINTQKITKAMKLVAAAKFARASQAVNAARPYSTAFDKMVTDLVASEGGELKSALMRDGRPKNILVVVLGTDRGLCGGLNTNLFRAARQWMDETKRDPAGSVAIDILPWGRKAVSWARKQKEKVLDGREKVLDRPNVVTAKALVDELAKQFLDEKYDAIYLAHNQFVNALTQKQVIVKLLPIDANLAKSTDASSSTDLIVEPGLNEMLEQLLTRKLKNLIFQAMLDGAASEFGSRMTAMDSATTNASEVRKKLALQYNRARQAAITKELIEIISGAEAL